MPGDVARGTRERRKSVRGFYASTALTCLLTGDRRPIDFTYLFIAPPLFVFTAVLTGLSMVLMHALDARVGFTFSGRRSITDSRMASPRVAGWSCQ